MVLTLSSAFASENPDATITYTAGSADLVDTVDNELASGASPNITDGVKPTFVSASATSDTNIKIVFSETISGGTVIFGAASQWTATSMTSSAAVISGADVDLTVNSLGNTAFTAADFAFATASGVIQDAAGNAVAAFSGQTIADGQSPTITSAVTGDAGVGLDKVTLTFSENVDANQGTTIFFIFIILHNADPCAGPSPP